MIRPTYLLLIAFLTACVPCVPENAPSDRCGAARLREPDVRYEPTPQRVVHQMLELAGVGPGDVVYDLGSADGRIPITAASQRGGGAWESISILIG